MFAKTLRLIISTTFLRVTHVYECFATFPTCRMALGLSLSDRAKTLLAAHWNTLEFFSIC